MANGQGNETAMTGYSPTADDDELAPGTVVGEFRIECKLGRGGMGTVYGAVHEVIGKRGAIKVLRRELCTDQKEVSRFVQEARAVNQIGHPNIVDVFAFGTLPDGRSYLVMEWLAGQSLRARLQKSPMTRIEVRDILDDVVRALEATHAKGIIHRDLKPDNVFLVEMPGERPRAKLLDFGLAKLTGELRPNQTRVGSMLGTPQYLAPEQARGEADLRSDIYALGVMLFELVSGKLPFEGKSTVDVVSMHLMENPPRLSTSAHGVTPELDDLVDAMLAKEPGDRPSLLRVRATVDRIATPPSKQQTLRTGLRTEGALGRHTGIKFAIAGLIGAIAVLIVVFTVRSIGPGPADDRREATRAVRQETPREARQEAKREARREAKAEPEAETPKVKPDTKAAEPPAPPGFWPADTPGTLVIQWNGVRTARFAIDGKAAKANEPIVLPPGRHKVAIFVGGNSSTQRVKIIPGETTTFHIRPPIQAPSGNDLNPLNNDLR